MPTPMIKAPVGRGTSGNEDDVVIVQQLLNQVVDQLGPGAKPLAVNGQADAKTIAAIEAYQRRVLNFKQPDGRVDPKGKTIRSLLDAQARRPVVRAAVHCWQGKTPTRGFELCARTAESEFKGPGLIRMVDTKAGLVSLFKDLKSRGLVEDLRIYCHSGVDGPIFSDGQFMPSQLRSGALPSLGWVAGVTASIIGCNTGIVPWTAAFAETQGVSVRGCAGYALFSKQSDRFVPFSGDPDSTPCYLDCFPGMQELIIKKYGYVNPSSIIEDVWRRLLLLPEWREARAKQLPPKPMKVIRPDGVSRDG